MSTPAPASRSRSSATRIRGEYVIRTPTTATCASGLGLSLQNQAGCFNAPYLPIGTYNVTAQLTGLGTVKRQTVPVQLNQTTKQDFVIDPQVAESITVTADAPRIDVSDGEVKQTMRSEEIM